MLGDKTCKPSYDDLVSQLFYNVQRLEFFTTEFVAFIILFNENGMLQWQHIYQSKSVQFQCVLEAIVFSLCLSLGLVIHDLGSALTLLRTTSRGHV